MRVMVAGGAGYIGSVVTEQLIRQGFEVTILDNLSTGHLGAVHPGALFVEADLRNPATIREAFAKHPVDAVMHFCACSLVGESVEKPLLYYENNVAGGLNLLKAMLEVGVKQFIFSSTAATYGEPEEIPLKETSPTRPTNPYGDTKLAFERLLHWAAAAHGLRYVTLRYFNACGASERYGEDHRPETHLIPIVLQVALGKRERVSVFGTDYPTPDGSCLRDYIHVLDLAQAHILALKALAADETIKEKIFNLGNGEGYSVLQLIEVARKVTGHPIPYQAAARRPGDPARLIASSDAIRKELGWTPEHPQLEAIIDSAWRWHRKYPKGYDDRGKGAK